MSRRIASENKYSTTREIVTQSKSTSKWKTDSNSSNNATLETTLKKGLKCNCNKRFIKYKKLNLKRETKINNFDEKQILSMASENFNTINTTISNNSLQVQITDTDSKDNLRIEKEIRRDINVSWENDLFIQIMERLQYLAGQPPQLYVQFPTELAISRTIVPIKVLIPIPDNYIQQQDHFEVIAKSAAKFGPLVKDTFEIFIKNGEERHLVQEKHNFDINATKKKFISPIKPVKTNKLNLEDKVNNWNNLVKTESVNSLEFKQKQKEIIIPKQIPQYSLSKESQLKIGGKGFSPKIWSPVPVSNDKLEIQKPIIPEPSSESESIIINDEYNKIKDIKMRPVIVTILKMKEEEGETSDESLDVFQEIIINKINLNVEEVNKFIKSRFEFNEKIKSEEKYEINYVSKNKKFNTVLNKS